MVMLERSDRGHSSALPVARKRSWRRRRTERLNQSRLETPRPRIASPRRPRACPRSIQCTKSASLKPSLPPFKHPFLPSRACLVLTFCSVARAIMQVFCFDIAASGKKRRSWGKRIVNFTQYRNVCEHLLTCNVCRNRFKSNEPLLFIIHIVQHKMKSCLWHTSAHYT